MFNNSHYVHGGEFNLLHENFVKAQDTQIEPFILLMRKCRYFCTKFFERKYEAKLDIHAHDNVKMVFP